MNASDIMASDVITVGPESCVQDVAGVLLANRISAVPVVDDKGKLIGIVSEGDLVRRIFTKCPARHAGSLGARGRAGDR